MSAGPVRLTRLRAALVAAGFAVVALVAAGCASTVSGSGAFAGGGTTEDPPTTSSSRSNSRSADFPDPTTSSRTSSSRSSSSTTRSSSSTPRTSSPTPSPSETDAALKQQLAETGTGWVHAYGNADVATFCALSDPPSLQAVLAEKGIASCDTLTITWDTDLDLQAQLQAFSIPDPSDILIIGDNAFILSFDTAPEALSLGLNWIKQADGSWKVDASVLSSS